MTLRDDWKLKSLSGRRLKFKPRHMVSIYIYIFANKNFSADGRGYIVIVENGVKLRLNIVDTPGYGDQVNNENWYA